MGTDKNTVIGFVLIGLLLMGYFYFNSKSSLAYEAEKMRLADSAAKANPVDRAKLFADSIRTDSMNKARRTAAFIDSLPKNDSLITVENEVLKIQFSTKGAQPRTVELKQFKTFQGKSLILQKGNFNGLSYDVAAGNQITTPTSDLFFSQVQQSTGTDNSKIIQLTTTDKSGNAITHEYVLKPNSYLVDLNIRVKGAANLFTKNSTNLEWKTEAAQVEKDVAYEKEQTHIGYLDADGYDFSQVKGEGTDEKKLEKEVSWISVKQQFFIAALANKNKFQQADINWAIPKDTSLHIITQTTAKCRLAFDAAGNAPLQLYYGPSDYNILKLYNNRMENMVPYGSGIFAFVKYINRHLLLPVFDMLRGNIANMGIVILLLTLFIRLLTSPILYRSYVSGAKMKALKPEVDKLKAKFGEDKQGFSVEQMKLWKSAGVSPLGGCLPALLQIPIFMSLYYFFQSNISLRGQSFLWAKDLASYDSILDFGFSIPLYGDHISLFTLTAVITSLLISIYSMSNMQDQDNPVMKYMPYIFPIFLLGVFNNLPAALTWYYTISNTITLILQIVIQKYIINHDKILAQIEENRKKPIKQSKLQERLAAMQEANKKLQEERNKKSK